MFYIGVTQAFALAFLISIYNVFLRISVTEWHIEPIAFTCYCLMMSAFILSLAAGPGRLAKETLKSPFTWLYSITLVSTYIADTYVVHYVSATEASFFSRLTIPISLAIAWLVFSRKPKLTDSWGVSLVILGLIWLTYLQPKETLPLVLLTVGLSALFQTLQFIIAETHKEATTANTKGTIRDEWRVTGLVTFISSGLFMFLSLCLAQISDQFDLNLSIAPSISDFTDRNTVYAALAYGAIILPFIRYFKWSASQNLKAENLLLFMAFIPLFTYSLEFIISIIVQTPSNSLIFNGERGTFLLFIAIIMTAGAGLTTFLRIKNQLKDTHGTFWDNLSKALTRGDALSIQHSNTAVDDYEIVCATLEHTEGDTEKAAELLKIPATTLQVLYDGKGSFALVEEESKNLSRRYRNHVASMDALTNIYNRSGFMAAFKKEISKHSEAVVLYIDLDKFKPINDTYGHEAGDFVLMKVAERLAKLFPKKGLVARLGGDEFCAVSFSSPSDDLVKSIKNALTEPMTFEGKTLEIGASVGVAHFPEQGDNLEDLLSQADAGMYKEKSER